VCVVGWAGTLNICPEDAVKNFFFLFEKLVSVYMYYNVLLLRVQFAAEF
jgi:hypothetical protein